MMNETPTQHPINNKRKPFNQRLGFWLAVLFITLIYARIHHQNLTHRQNTAKTPPLVVLTQAATRTMPVFLSALGTVTPTYTVTVKTQVNGQLIHVLFREGQLVKAGDLLAEIDDRPYQAQLMEYEGQLARDQAQLANALIDLKRYQTLWKQDAVSEQTLATQESLVKQLQGTIKLDQGLVDTAKVNLTYTKITSPIDGRIGLRLVDPGNIVQTSDTTGIAVINLISPITVVFTLPEDDISEVVKQIDKNKPLTVEAFNRQQTTLLTTGQLLTIDNQVDTTTGTVKLKAVFDNKNNELFPNQFVNIRLLLKTLPNAVVLPTATIQHDNNGSFVYLYHPDQTVSVNPVVTGITHQDITTINSGIKPGQTVVLEGMDKLTTGMKVADASNPLPAKTKRFSLKSLKRLFFT